MKKIIILTLAFAVLLSMTGCKANSQDTTSTQPSITQSSTEEATGPTGNIEIEQKPMCAISFVTQLEETTDETEKVRFRYSHQNISLVLPEPEVADKIILNHLNRMDHADQYADSLLAESLKDEHDNMGIPFMYYITNTPMRFDSTILSIHENIVLYTGGIHPNTYGLFYSYDLLSGHELNLSDVLTEKITADTISEIIIKNLAETDGLWPDYKDIVKDVFKDGLDTWDIWYFSNEGLCFYFDPYVLAPYAAGPITVTLPYSELVGTLCDEYFPAEQDSYRGNLVVEKFTVDTQKDFTQFAEVILIEDGTKILLSAEGAITDIRIQAVTNMYGGSNIDGYTVMTVQSLTPGDAIMVEFDSATTKLLVNYRNGDQHETKIITCNQDDIDIS